MPSSQHGFLVVADITGYTSYLSHSELEHAQDTLKTLLNLLIDHTRPPLALSGLEGDAVLSYTVDSERFEGQAFVEMIEQTYVAFKRAIDLMVMNTTCKCNACANINNLDLKFIVHHGEFVVQRFGGREELVGNDVNVVHRVMKNRIPEVIGFTAYTFFSEAAIDALGIAELADELTAYGDEFPDLGEVRGWVMDMKPIWEARKNQSDLSLDDRVMAQWEEDYPVPPEVMWGYLTNPETRAVFSGATRQVTHDRRKGRVAEGTVYECFHGDGSITLNIILEWRPFSRIVFRTPVARKSYFIGVIDLEPSDAGTHVELRYGRAHGPRYELVIGFVMWILFLKRREGQGLPKLRELIEKEIAAGRLDLPEEKLVDGSVIEEAAVSALPTP